MKQIRLYARPRLAYLGVLLAVVALSTFGMISVASAGGATVTHENFNFSECTPWDYSWPTGWSQGESCFESKAVLQQVATPSGNILFSWKDKGTFSGWDRGEEWSYGTYQWDYESSSEFESSSSRHAMKGDTQVQSWSSKSDYVFTDNLTGYSTTCTYESVYHYANGKVTKDTILSECVITP